MLYRNTRTGIIFDASSKITGDEIEEYIEKVTVNKTEEPVKKTTTRKTGVRKNAK